MKKNNNIMGKVIVTDVASGMTLNKNNRKMDEEK